MEVTSELVGNLWPSLLQLACLLNHLVLGSNLVLGKRYSSDADRSTVETVKSTSSSCTCYICLAQLPILQSLHYYCRNFGGLL